MITKSMAGTFWIQNEMSSGPKIRYLRTQHLRNTENLEINKSGKSKTFSGVIH